MTAQFRDSLVEWAVAHAPEVLDWIDRRQLEDLDEIAATAWDPRVEADFVGLPPPVEILHGEVSSLETLQAAVERVEWRWRPDALFAIENVVSDLDGP